MTVRTRFAPSPTGQVHIGNIRAAIYNWLYARHAGGQFLLRIEDTDRERSTSAAVQAVLDALAWLGLNADEPPLYQSARTADHLAAAEELLRQGRAYKADKGGAGQGECVLFRMPGTDMRFHDEIKGDLAKKAADLQDFVIVRSNGTPVFQALGAPAPKYAHLPMIVNAQGKPYSKRDGAAYVGDFRAKGYLPAALLNYLALLGWSPGGDRELLSAAELIQLFSLDRVQSSPAQMDPVKLQWMNGEYMRALPRAAREAECRAVLQARGLWDDALPADYLGRVLEVLQERVKLFTDIADAGYFFTEDYPYDEASVRKRLLKPGALELLAAVRAAYAALPDFSAAAAEKALREIAVARGAGFGDCVHPVRVAVSGTAIGPSLFHLLEILGRERTRQRLDRTLQKFGTP